MAELETGTAGVRPGEAGQIGFSFRVRAIALILSAGLILRLSLAALPGFGIDVGLFQFWSVQLADRGPWNFYDADLFSDYAPGYLYVLWFIGGVNAIFGFGDGAFHYVLKLPAVLADLGSAYLLFRTLEGQRPLFRFGAPALYLISPAVLLIGPVWGQVDSILAFFLLLTIYYFTRGRPLAGAVSFAVGFLVKPQAIAVLPLLAFWVLRDQLLQALGSLPQVEDRVERFLRLLRDLAARLWPFVVAPLASAYLLILPFFPGDPWRSFHRLFDQLRFAANFENYRQTSLNAYNFWAMKVGLWKPDNATFSDIPYWMWGLILFAASTLAILYVFGRARTPGLMALGVAASVLAFFVFSTRMHERYLFPFFLPFLMACAILNYRLLWAAFVGLSVIHFFNLYYVYSFPQYNPNGPAVEFLFTWIQDNVFLLSLLTTLAFPLLLATGGFLMMRSGEDRLKGVHPEGRWLR